MIVDFIQENYWLPVLLLVGTYLLWSRYGLYLRGVRQVGGEEAIRMVREQHAAVLDVREKREFAASRIPGSRNVPLSQFKRRLKSLDKYRGRPLVVGCRSGSRSARACVILRKNGFEDVYNLKGGIGSWASSMRKLEG